MPELVSPVNTTAQMHQDIFHQIHRDLPREGPGDPTSTARALALLTDLPHNPALLDIGCGPGTHTIHLAKSTAGKVVALDSNPYFLDVLDDRALAEGVAEQITTVKGSMFDLALPQNEFDVIWAEGSIFIIGFERGLKEWKRVLKNNGYLAATHLSWLCTDIPDEPKAFWAKEYPAITSIAENLEIIRQAGYVEVGHFTLPETAWWVDYYTPLEERLKGLKQQWATDSVALKVIADTQMEIDLYREYSDSYGYVFYIMRKPGT